MSKVATNFINQYNLTPQMGITELSNYTEELLKDLKDAKVRNHARNRIQSLGFNKEQTNTLIPMQASGRRVVGRVSAKELAKYIKENEENLKSEEINELAYNFAISAPTEIAQSSRLKLLRKELIKLDATYLTIKSTYIYMIAVESNKKQRESQERREDKGFDCPDFFSLEKVQERLKEYNTENIPSMQNLIDMMIMLCMRPADVKNLHIDYYSPSNTDWYKSKYSWYCTGYAKNEKDEP